MKRIFVAAAVLVLLEVGAAGQSRLDFPRVSLGAGSLTGIAIVNPNPQSAQVTLTAYGPDGQPLQGANFVNPVTVAIEAGRQFSNVTAGIFGSGLDPATPAWVRAESAAAGLTGFFLFLNLPTTFFDGADLPRSGTTIFFSELQIGDGVSTELNLINPSEARADIQLSLVGPVPPATAMVSLPARGVARLDAAQFFGVSMVPANSYVMASSTQSIAGFEFVRSRGDLLGLNAVPASETLNTLFFPQLAVLGLFQTRLTVVNANAAVDAIVTITAFRPDGTRYAAPMVARNPVTRLVRRGQALREDLEGMFGFTGSQTVEGWVRVDSTAQAINGSIAYSIPSLNSQAAVASVAQGSTRAIFSHIATSQGFFTGVAALNAGSLAAQVRIVAVRPDGSRLGSFSTTLLPGQRISRLIDQMIPEAAGQAGGLIFARSDQPVYLTSLFGSGTVLANIPPQPAPATFQPDAGLPNVGVRPPLAILNPAGTQNFQIQGASGNTQWTVNGVVNGNAALGTITATANGATYTAPAMIPTMLPVTIGAQNQGQSAAASVDLVTRQSLVSGLGDVRSVAYLKGLQRLYSAELAVGAADSGGPRRQTSGNSLIVEVTKERKTVVTIPGEDITKMIPFTGADRRDYLLVTAANAGQVLRINPANRTFVAVATGLNAPTTLVEDPGTGNLLVADGAGLRTIPRAALNMGLAAAEWDGGGPRKAASPLRPGNPSFQTAAMPRGVAVDRCTGRIYTSEPNNDPMIEAAAVIRETDPQSGAARTVTTLTGPGQLLGIYRTGQTCPDSFHLLALDSAADTLILVIPSEDEVLEWEDAIDGIDLAFQAGRAGSSSPNDSILVAQPPRPGQAGGVGEIIQIPLPDIYDENADNPPPSDFLDIEVYAIEFEDLALEMAVRQALELASDEPILDEETASLFELDASNRGVSRLGGIEDVYNLEVLDLSSSDFSGTIEDLEPLRDLFYMFELNLRGNRVSGIEPLEDLLLVERLNLSRNQISNIEALRELTLLTAVDLSDNQVADIAPLVDNFGLAEGAVVDLTGNPLDVGDCPDIHALRNRGVEVIAPQLEGICN